MLKKCLITTSKYREFGQRINLFQPNFVEYVLTRVNREYGVDNKDIITQELMASGGFAKLK